MTEQPQADRQLLLSLKQIWIESIAMHDDPAPEHMYAALGHVVMKLSKLEDEEKQL